MSNVKAEVSAQVENWGDFRSRRLVLEPENFALGPKEPLSVLGIRGSHNPLNYGRKFRLDLFGLRRPVAKLLR